MTEVRRLVIRGVVQGVGFRYAMMAEARALGVTGWVRNRRNGSVEVLAEGAPADLSTLLERLRKGPRGALVTDVKVEWNAAKGDFADFEIEATEW